MQQSRILIVDEDTGASQALAAVLEREGYRVQTCPDASTALSAVDAQLPALTITESLLPGMSGLDLLKRLKQRDPQAAVVVVTANADVESAVEALHQGALDYLRKPAPTAKLLELLRKTTSAPKLGQGPARAGDAKGCCSAIIGSSPEMQKLFRSIEQVAPSTATVLITGESGTGKELVAAAIHRGSPRASGPFVRLSCSALSESLLESELFGHERGSFTGAEKRRLGRIEQAHSGTLFLDEIGELSPTLQVKLLRVLQERAFERVGSNETQHVDVRILTATHRDLRQLVQQGVFREDLFYRLNVVSLEVPPLRQRRPDIPQLAAYFVARQVEQNGYAVEGFTPAALDALMAYDWPGNVRELENVVEHAAVFAGSGQIGVEHLPPELRQSPQHEGLPEIPGASMKDLERYAILKTLDSVGGSTRRTAEILGISVRKIQYRLREYAAAHKSRAPQLSPDQAA